MRKKEKIKNVEQNEIPNTFREKVNIYSIYSNYVKSIFSRIYRQRFQRTTE